MKKCPYCAEDIQDAAIVCKHCGRDLGQAQPAAARGDGQRSDRVAKRARAGCLGVIILFGLLMVVGWCASSGTTTSTNVPARAPAAAPASTSTAPTASAAKPTVNLPPEGTGRYGRHSYSWRVQDGGAAFMFEPALPRNDAQVLSAIRHVLSNDFKINMTNVGEPRPVQAFLRYATAGGIYDVLLVKNDDGAVWGFAVQKR